MSFLYEEENHDVPGEEQQAPRTQIYQKPEHAKRRVDQECHTALSESLRIAAQTNQLAQATATELQLQTEQIQRIHRDSEVTRDNLRTSEFLLKGMKGWWSSLTQMFQEPPKPKPSDIQPISPSPNQDAPLVTQVQEPVPTPKGEMSAGLNQLSLMLEEMKHRAMATGRELEYQNMELESIHTLTTGNDEMLEKQRRDLAKLMK